MNILAYALQIFALLPGIAQGIHAVKADLSLNDKLGAASDALAAASNVSISLLPSKDQPLATSIAQTAYGALASIVTALHTAKTPAVVAVAQQIPAAGAL